MFLVRLLSIWLLCNHETFTCVHLLPFSLKTIMHFTLQSSGVWMTPIAGNNVNYRLRRPQHFYLHIWLRTLLCMNPLLLGTWACTKVIFQKTAECLPSTRQHSKSDICLCLFLRSEPSPLDDSCCGFGVTSPALVAPAVLPREAKTLHEVSLLVWI